MNDLPNGRVPGFTAEASLSRPTFRYGVADLELLTTGSVVAPQLPMALGCTAPSNGVRRCCWALDNGRIVCDWAVDA